MRIDIKKKDNILILTPSVKSIDSSNSTSFKSQGIDLINQGNTNLIINLSNIDFIDSIGLGSIISIFKALTDKGHMALFGTKPSVNSLFKMTRMDRVFQMYASENDAIQAIENTLNGSSR